jgi:uroporphyrinogen-III synthase
MRITIPEDMKYFCITEAVAVYLQHYIHYRKRKVFYGASGKMQELVTVLNKHANEKFLFVTPEVLNEEIIAALDSSKISYTKAIMYRTVSNDFGSYEDFNYDMLLFFSPIGVQSLFKNFPEFKQGEIHIGCFGSTTATAVKESGLRLDLEAPTPQYPSMAMALEAYVKENAKKHKK